MNDFNGLIEQLVNNRADATTVLVLADWYEADGPDGKTDPTGAEAVRWLLTPPDGKSATAVRHRPYSPEGEGSETGSWFNGTKIKDAGLEDPESDLPDVIYDALEGGKVTANHRTYPTAREAYEAFVAAFKKARKEGNEIPA